MTPAPPVPADDRGLLLGDGLFETILANGGRLVLIEAHLARLARGCEVLGLPAPDLDQARRLCQAALGPVGNGRAAVRLTLTAGSGGRGLDRPPAPAPRLFATAAISPRPESPARVATVAIRRNEGSPASRLKTLAYLDSVLARREAAAAGADEALMLNNRGEVACAAAANLFWTAGGRLFTPAPECGVLEGVMRRELIDRARRDGLDVLEVRERPETLIRAGAVFLTNSLIGVRPVGELDGRVIQGDQVAARAAALVADLAA